MPPKDFIRVHKSYILSINKIYSIERSRIFICDNVIPVCDTYMYEFFNILDGKNI
ncbi:LytTR family transcriptional regulator DNA-binding domain-containing protein [Mucilaginibacter sp. 5C4]|uniref:LytTR family transcriptional regulator DNA-binding domain-containing protein n=1 Tax=Mucilaginibacter sp. 5C4 TaxID=3048589 RepID=UPI002B22588D|nr:LytTR family transcriptional regulator DNA-binding domain-containing protein [Mucilaginibacter sp. 5C4]MEB0303551.1 LytTR family transcriptional regulator DNA-binding domain-containing protein [Mucilaginibacter sp. 5C4]